MLIKKALSNFKQICVQGDATNTNIIYCGYPYPIRAHANTFRQETDMRGNILKAEVKTIITADGITVNLENHEIKW